MILIALLWGLLALAVLMWTVLLGVFLYDDWTYAKEHERELRAKGWLK